MNGWTGTATLSSGDVVFFRSQDTWTGAAPVLTLTNGITYDGTTYGSGTRATLEATSGDGSGSTGVVAGPASSVNIQGFNVTAALITSGIDLGSYGGLGYSNITVDNCIVHDVGARGIYIGTIAGNNLTVSNITVKNSTIYNIGWSGIVVYPTWVRPGHKVENVLIRNCTVYTTGFTKDGEGVYIKNDADNVIVEFCRLYDNLHGVHLETYEDPNVGTIDNATIRYNVIHDNTHSGFDTLNKGRIVTASIYGNIFYNNGKSESTSRGTSIRINRSTLGQSTSTYNIYNNTIYIGSGTTSAYPMGFVCGDGQPDSGTGCSGTATVIFKNNIIYSNKSGAVPFRDVDSKVTDHSNNLIYNAISATSAHVNAGTTTYDRNGGVLDITNWEPTAQKTDPSFTGGTLPTGFTGTYGVNMVPNTDYFSITSGNAIGNGATLGYPYNGCINQAGYLYPGLRPADSYDIGAYQNPSALLSTVPTLLGGTCQGCILTQ
jgi:hypothetical protein